jgi:hypothetical protein
MSPDRDQLLRRTDWHAAARLLHERNPGMSNGEIGRLLGVTNSAVWKVLNPERTREMVRRDNARPERRVRKTQWDRDNYEHAYKNECACGEPKMKVHERCQGCADATAAVRRTLTEGMWADGWTCAEIAAALGHSTNGMIPAMRRRGWDLPHRRTPEQVARIRAGVLAGWRRQHESRPANPPK